MFKILKHGALKITTTFYKTTCFNCGCEFECTSDEFTEQTRTMDANAWYATVKCPDCEMSLHLRSGNCTQSTETVEFPYNGTDTQLQNFYKTKGEI